MTKAKTSTSRNRYSQEYKTEALVLGEKIGIGAAARQLGLNEAQLYSWRGKARLALASNIAQNQLRIENVRLKRQLAEQKEELEILKKGSGVLFKSSEEKYAFISNHSGEFTIVAMCRALGASRSGFYLT